VDEHVIMKRVVVTQTKEEIAENYLKGKWM
jgi:hypothetical protein